MQINGFATVFLLHIGLKSSQIGVVLALGNILGVILQPFVAAAADRAKRVTLQQMTAGMAIAIILLLILMQCMSKMVPGIVLSFLIVNMLLQVVTATDQFYQFVLCESWNLCRFWNRKRSGLCILCGGSFVFGNSDLAGITVWQLWLLDVCLLR